MIVPSSITNLYPGSLLIVCVCVCGGGGGGEIKPGFNHLGMCLI